MKISIVVPVYKVEKYINRCVDSILAQTFTDFELILVDDGSPDNCGAICDDYAAEDSRIHVIHQKNGGLSAARNAGIDWVFTNSDSEWITFIDSDDWVHAKYLESLQQAAQHSHSEVVIGGFECTEGENPDVDESKLSETMWNVERFYCEQNVTATVAWGKLYKKHCFQKIRYPVGKLHEDEFVTYRILFQYDTVAVIKQPLYAYYQNPEGITGSKWNPKRLDWFEARQEQLSFFKGRFGNAYPNQLKLFLNELWRIRCLVLKEYAGNETIQKKLRKYMGRTLLRNRKDYPIAKYPYYYEFAFPKEMYVYWIVICQLNKLRQ